jgi:hypothetical protein
MLQHMLKQLLHMKALQHRANGVFGMHECGCTADVEDQQDKIKDPVHNLVAACRLGCHVAASPQHNVCTQDAFLQD